MELCMTTMAAGRRRALLANAYAAWHKAVKTAPNAANAALVAVLVHTGLVQPTTQITSIRAEDGLVVICCNGGYAIALYPDGNSLKGLM